MTVSRLNSLYAAGLGLFLGAGSWDGLYEALDLPVPKPSFYAQLAGVMLLGWAWLLWTRPPLGAAAVVNGLAAALLVVWLATGRVPADALGYTLLALVAAAFAVFAALEARR